MSLRVSHFEVHMKAIVPWLSASCMHAGLALVLSSTAGPVHLSHSLLVHRGGGQAIVSHLSAPAYRPTEACAALYDRHECQGQLVVQVRQPGRTAWSLWGATARSHR